MIPKSKKANRVRSVPILQSLHALVQLLDPNHEVRDGVEQPVEDESSRDQESVALTLHYGFLVAEVLGRRARVTIATRPSLVLPVDVHQKEEAKRHHRQERLQEVASDGDEALAEAVEARKSEKQDHHSLCTGGVAKHDPLQSHRIGSDLYLSLSLSGIERFVASGRRRIRFSQKFSGNDDDGPER